MLYGWYVRMMYHRGVHTYVRRYVRRVVTRERNERGWQLRMPVVG